MRILLVAPSKLIEQEGAPLRPYFILEAGLPAPTHYGLFKPCGDFWDVQVKILKEDKHVLQSDTLTTCELQHGGVLGDLPDCTLLVPKDCAPTVKRLLQYAEHEVKVINHPRPLRINGLAE